MGIRHYYFGLPNKTSKFRQPNKLSINIRSKIIVYLFPAYSVVNTFFCISFIRVKRLNLSVYVKQKII